MQFHPQNDLLLIAKWLHDYKSLREKKRKITFGQISAALTIVYGSSQVSAVTEMVQHSTQLCQFATNFPDPSLKQRNIGMRTRDIQSNLDDWIFMTPLNFYDTVCVNSGCFRWPMAEIIKYLSSISFLFNDEFLLTISRPFFCFEGFFFVTFTINIFQFIFWLECRIRNWRFAGSFH